VSVRLLIDFDKNDKFQFLGFRIFLEPFFIQVFAKFIENKNHGKVDFSFIFYGFSNFRV